LDDSIEMHLGEVEWGRELDEFSAG